MGKNVLENSKRSYTWDIAKVFALLLVAYGHLIGTGTYAYEIPGYFKEPLSEPIIPASEHVLWKVSQLLYNFTGTETAVIGVVIFFIASGYFIPGVQKKFENLQHYEGELFWNRLLRLYPEVITSYIVASSILFLYQGIICNAEQYITSALCISIISGVGNTLGVLWYLNVLIFVYFISSFIKKYSTKNIMSVYILLLIGSILPIFQTSFSGKMAGLITGGAYISRAATICFIGIMLRLVSESDNRRYQVWWVSICTILTVIIINVYYQIVGTYETYGSIKTYVLAFAVIAISKCFAKMLDRMNKAEMIKRGIHFIITISLPFYIIHVPLGLVIMHFLKKYNVNAYIRILAACIASFLLAWLISVSVNCVKTYLAKK